MKFKNRAERTAKKYEAAQALGITVNALNKRGILENSLESTQKRAENAKKAQEHREKCEKLAKLVINGTIKAKQACAELGLSPRQFYRWIQKEKAKSGDE